MGKKLVNSNKVLHPKFGEKFLVDYSGKMTDDPKIAIIELVANAWDAGAKRVDITWPVVEVLLDHEHFEIRDNGIGMTEEEFRDIWTTLGYDRRTCKGPDVVFPNDEKIERKAYGQNGKGRLSLFCFSDQYTIQSCKEGNLTTAKITKKPVVFYEINIKDGKNSSKQGTSISCIIDKNYIEKDELIDVLSSRFGADPHFEVFVNGSKIDLFNLEKVDSKIIKFDNNLIEIEKVLPSEEFNQYNVVWLVNNRRADLNSWNEMDIYLDRKTRNKYSFLVKVDFLEKFVKSDWSGFKENEVIKAVKGLVKEGIKELLSDDIKKSQHVRKLKAVNESKKVFRELSPVSRVEVGKYINYILEECPSITNKDLSSITKILANMEVSKRGFELLDQLVALKDGEIDKLSKILEKWSINDAYYVLDELYGRLRLIKELEILVEDPKTLELKQLQPIFKKGLWIFGPEYEGTTNFSSNKTLNFVMKNLLKEDIVKTDPENLKKRPDFVVLENDSNEESTLGTFSSKNYDKENTGEVDGYRKILILELKRGGSTIGYKDFNQANFYSSEISDSGKLQGNPKIITYLMGANVSSKLKDEFRGGNIVIRPRTYDTIINKAKARTLNLIENLKNVKGITDLDDPEIKEVLSEGGDESLDK